MEKSRLVFQWDEQPLQMCKVFCTLLESQMLVDLTIICNSYTIKVHKCVMAANSSYFRDRLQRDSSIDRVVINGLKHPVLKSIIEFVYCGETSISDENVPELIDASKYLGISGITSVMPDKLGCDITEIISDMNLQTKPPVFFSKNEKSRYYFKEKDVNMTDRNIKIMLESSDYPIFNDVSRRRRPSQPKVTDEAHVALAKEEAASRFALEMLKKDLSNNGNVFVIDETCTEATVETNLSAQYGNANNLVQLPKYVLENTIKNDANDLVKSSEHGEPCNIQLNNLLQTKRSPGHNDCENSFELQNNVPMIYKASDGNFVNVSNQILESLSNSQAIEYHVLPEEGTVDFQQYICNNFNGYSVEIHNSENDSSLSNGCYEIIKHDENTNEEKKQLTYTQLVADTVSADYDTSGFESHFSGNMSLVENLVDNSSIQYIPTTESKSSETANFISNFPVNYSTKTYEDKTIMMSNEIIPKKKRGRPPKRKLLDSLETPIPSNNRKIDYIFDEKNQEVSEIIELDLSNKSAISVMDMNNKCHRPEQTFKDSDIAEYLKEANENKENTDPADSDSMFTNRDDANDMFLPDKSVSEMKDANEDSAPLQEIMGNSYQEDNRRQTRSSSKFNY